MDLLQAITAAHLDVIHAEQDAEIARANLRMARDALAALLRKAANPNYQLEMKMIAEEDAKCPASA